MERIYQIGKSKKITNAKNRWFFNVDGVGNVLAAGFLLRNKEKYLMQCHKDKNYFYSDFGGKTEYYDVDIYDTVMREVCEESNGYLNVSRKELMQSEKYYFRTSKYLLFIVDTCKDYKEVIKLMGNYEEHDSKPRTTNWVENPVFYDCHPRIGEYFNKCVI